MNFEDIYFSSPVFIQYALINLQALHIKHTRYNGNFRCFLEEYLKSDPEKIKTDLLCKFLQEAGNTTFWRKKFNEFGITPRQTDDPVSEINKLPILSKNEARLNIDHIINKKSGTKISYNHTSGTTGSGLVFPQTQEMENRQWAVWWRYRSWHGLSQDLWMGWGGGRSIVGINQPSPPYWRINYPLKQIMFSAHHLNVKTVAFYHREIRERKLSWLHGYPSQLSLLAQLIQEQNLADLPDIKIITVSAENLLSKQKSIIETVFNAPVKQHYGLAEGVANISEHPDGSLIPDQDFCYTEFIPVDKSDPGLCRIIGTNYSNIAFPLIRYDTGDLAHVEWEPDGKPRVISLDGRKEDFVTLPNGVRLGRLDHIFKDFVFVQEAQIFQNKKYEIILKIVKGHNYNEDIHENMILGGTRKRLGSNIPIAIEYTDQIPRTKAGKFRFVISEIK